LTGTSLGSWAQCGGIELPRALAVLVQICDGLGAAHDVGVVHRDLKPDNVIVVPTSDGAELVKLLDFGVAKLLNRDDEDVGFQTAAGSVIGTPAYMSPEQAGGMEIDARSDIYSLGAIMYELFSGQPMFRGRSFGEYVRKHLTETPVPPRQTPGGAEIDPRLEAVILRCLDKDPDQRFSHIVELREALLQMLGGMAATPSLAGLSVGDLFPQGIRRSTPPAVIHVPPSSSQPSQVPPTHGPSGSAVVSGAHPPPPLYLTEQDFPSPARRPRAAAFAPWRWFAGGGVAGGIALGAAIWVAGRGGPELTPTRPLARTPTERTDAAQPSAPSTTVPSTAAAPTTAAPTTAAASADPPAPRPPLVEVRFDSSPSGSVFAEGQAAALCRTPCSFDIDVSDGGSVEHRTFVVKRAGYQDSPIVVDLTAPRRGFEVTLQPAAAEPVIAGHSEPRARDTEAKTTTERRGKRAPKPAKKNRKDAAVPGPRDAKEPRDAGEPSDPDTDGDSAGDRASEPTPTRSAPARKPSGVPAIDPADTLDPFRKK